MSESISDFQLTQINKKSPIASHRTYNTITYIVDYLESSEPPSRDVSPDQMTYSDLNNSQISSSTLVSKYYC